MMRSRALVLVVLMALCFLAGYTGIAHAGTIFGRCYDTWNDGCGYFLNRVGSCPVPVRDDVMPGGIGAGGINNPTQFIDAVLVPLRTGDQQHKTGAAFIIQTMIGQTVSRLNPPSNAQIADWESRIYYAASQGRIKYNQTFSYSLNSCYQGNATPFPNDDMFWDTVASGYGVQTGLGIQFLNTNNTIAYEIQLSCANPLGVVSALPAPPTYTITGRTTVSSPTVYPGQTVTFSHYLKDSGPDSATINWSTKDGITNATTGTGTNAITAGTEIKVRDENVTIPNNAAFGSKYCRYISFSPSQNGAGTGNGATVCTQVVANFNLTPIVTPSVPTAQQNDLVTFTYAITVSGPTRSTSVTCKAAGQINGPGYTPLPQQDVNRNPPVVPQPSFSCNRELSTGTTQVSSEIVNVGNTPPGSSVCRSLVINPKDQTGGFRSSAEACVVVAKTPYVQFMGNDVWAGGGFAAITPQCNLSSKIQTVAHTLSNGTVAGSAVEYAAFALGKIINFGSANKALVASSGLTGVQLTFSNVNATNLGNFGVAQHCINDYIANYTKTSKDPVPGGNAIDVSRWPSGTQLDIVSAAPISFSGTMPVGSEQVYLIEGDVNITGDLKYPSIYSGLTSIPSLVIIATGNITVKRNVQQMDGIFITHGNFYTCDVAVGTTLSVNPPCEKQLVINGSVSVGRLQLLRTFGADGTNDTQRKLPAEMFDFNSEIYLRNALNGANPNILRTVSEQDLPPRF